MDEEEKKQLLDVVRGIDIAQYRYLEDDSDDPLRLGLIAEEAPLEVLSVATSTREGALLGVDLYKLTTLTLAGVQELADTVGEMELRLQALERAQAGASSTAPEAAGESGTGKGGVLQALADMGIRMVEGILRLGKTAVSTLTVGSPEAPSGITLYDEDTGAPYCLKVKGGQTVTVPGACTDRAAASGNGSDSGADGGTGGSGAAGGATSSAPVVTLIGASPVSVALGERYVDQGVSVTSPSGAAILGVTLMVDGVAVEEIAIDTSATGTYVITYTATDEEGRSDSVERVVIVGGVGAPVDAADASGDGGTATPPSSGGATSGTSTPENANGGSAQSGGTDTGEAASGNSGTPDANAESGADANGAGGAAQAQEEQRGAESGANDAPSGGASAGAAPAAGAESGAAQGGDSGAEGDSAPAAESTSPADESGAGAAGDAGAGSEGGTASEAPTSAAAP